MAADAGKASGCFLVTSGPARLHFTLDLLSQTIMQKLLLLIFVTCGLASLAGSAPSNFQALHGSIPRFGSTNEITQYFETNSISFKVPPLKRHADRYFWVASYPYSGVDTIDVYCFRQRPSSGWKLQMLYYAIRPKSRDISVGEEAAQFVVKNGPDQLLTFAIQPER